MRRFSHTTAFLALLSMLLLQALPAFTQSQEPWIRFEQRKSERFGYRDRSGKTVVAPTLYRVIADTFHNIIAVQDTSFQGYFLLRDGRKVGTDSLYTFELEPDCETEGLIRFKSPSNGKVGFLDTKGRVAIPAIYDYAEPFFNGFAVAYRNGHLECADKDTANCEHHFWTGGEHIIINPRNEILAAGLKAIPRNINWYAVETAISEPDTARFITIRGDNNVSLVFANFEWEFHDWLHHRFLPALRTGDSSIAPYLFPQLITPARNGGWQKLSIAGFLRRYPTRRLNARLSEGAMKNSTISDDELNPYLHTGSLFRNYFTSCLRPFQERFPCFILVINREKAGQTSGEQDHFSFLRTESGYKLIGLRLAD